MRLEETQIEAIKNLTWEIFGPEASVFLFGSRVNPLKKGGDIDLYIETKGLKNIFQKKIEFIRRLYEHLGLRKIDVIINNEDGADLLIYKIAREEGIRL